MGGGSRRASAGITRSVGSPGCDGLAATVRVSSGGRGGGVGLVSRVGMRDGLVSGGDLSGAACGKEYGDEEGEGDCDDREEGDLDALSWSAGRLRVDGGYACDVGVVEGFGGLGRGYGGDAGGMGLRVCRGPGRWGGDAGGIDQRGRFRFRDGVGGFGAGSAGADYQWLVAGAAGCRGLVGAVRGSGLGRCELVDGRGVVGALGQDAGEGVGEVPDVEGRASGCLVDGRGGLGRQEILEGEDEVVLVMEFPEGRVGGEGLEAEEDDEGGEAVGVGTEAVKGFVEVLVVGMSGFGVGRPWYCGR